MSALSSELEYYVHQFQSLRQDNNPARYPADTNHASPHKPLLLLSVIDLFSEGSVRENLIPLTPALCDLFNGYWKRIMPPDWRGDIAMPFFHLTGDGFWHLVPSPGSEGIISSGKRLRSIRLLHDHTLGARLDNELFSLLQNEEPRELLRITLIETHFSDNAHSLLIEQGVVNIESFKYTLTLLEQARRNQQVKEISPELDLPQQIRDQGFRRAVVEAYNHRCAISGIRILTIDYHTAVDAAHIIPWSISQNDDPRNGLALNKLCHWAFDEGLVTISPEYVIYLSSELTTKYNSPGFLGTLHERPIFLPEDKNLWPEPEFLSWHQSNRYRR